MRIKNYYLIVFAAGVILQLIHSYVDIKAIWYAGCVLIIISPFLPGGFLQIDFKKSPKKQEKKENSIQEPKNCTFDSIEKNSEQDDFPPS